MCRSPTKDADSKFPLWAKSCSRFSACLTCAGGNAGLGGPHGQPGRFPGQRLCNAAADQARGRHGVRSAGPRGVRDRV